MEWLADNPNSCYPIIGFATDIGVSEVLVELLVAFQADPEFGEDVSPYLAGITIIDPLSLVIGLGGSVFLTFSAATHTVTTSAVGDYLVVQWTSAASTAKVVLRQLAERSFDVFTNSDETTNVLDPSTVIRFPASVTSFSVIDGDDNVTDITDSDVVIEEGYNCELGLGLPDDTGELVDNPLSLAFSPGAGLGRVDGCEDIDHLIRSISGTGPGDDSGRLLMRGDSCLRVTPSGSGVTVQGDCQACCQCQDYGDSYEGIRDAFNVGVGVGVSLAATAGSLTSACGDFNNADTRVNKSSLIVRVIPKYGWQLTVQVFIANSTTATIPVSTVYMTVNCDATLQGMTYMDGTGLRQGPSARALDVADPSGAYPTWNISTGRTIPPGGWWSYKFEVSIDDAHPYPYIDPDTRNTDDPFWTQAVWGSASCSNVASGATVTQSEHRYLLGHLNHGEKAPPLTA